MRTGSPMSSTSASPLSPMAPAWIDELHRLLDGHEVAGDVGVGDGDRAARLDLGPEGAEHGAAAAEHVAEAHARVGAVGVGWRPSAVSRSAMRLV